MGQCGMINLCGFKTITKFELCHCRFMSLPASDVAVYTQVDTCTGFNEIPSKCFWALNMEHTWGHSDLAFYLWAPKSYPFILESKWKLCPNLKTFSRLQVFDRWDRQEDTVMLTFDLWAPSSLSLSGYLCQIWRHSREWDKCTYVCMHIYCRWLDNTKT